MEQPQDEMHRGNSDAETSYGEGFSAEGASGEDLKNVLLNLIYLRIVIFEHSLESLKTEEERAHEVS